MARVAPLLLIPLAGCFDGADALHLPCDGDGDCGRGQSCIPAEADPSQKFCDGPPDTFGPVTTSTSGTTGSGVTTDPGTTTTDGSGSSTGPIVDPICGDGMVEGDEECEQSAPAQTTCDGRQGDLTCTDACRCVVLEEDFSIGGGAFLPGLPGGLASLPTALDSSPIEFGRLTDNTYGINESYPDPGTNDDGGVVYAYAGPFELPALSDPATTRYELRFDHRYAYEPMGGCDAAPLTDGARVVLWVEGSANVLEPEPEGGYPGNIATDASCDVSTHNPFERANAYVGIAPEAPNQLTAAQFVVPASAVTGDGGLHIILISSYNCRECSVPALSPGWRIDNVQLGAFAAD